MSNRRQATIAPAISESFDDVVVPHLDAGYRLAHWLTGNAHDAEDVVQEASLRALRYFRTFTGGSGRAGFLQLFATRLAAGIAARTRPWTHSMRNNTAAIRPAPILNRC